MISNQLTNNPNKLPLLNDKNNQGSVVNGVLPSLSKTGNNFYPRPFRDNSSKAYLEQRKHSNRHEKLAKNNMDDAHSARQIEFP